MLEDQEAFKTLNIVLDEPKIGNIAQHRRD